MPGCALTTCSSPPDHETPTTTTRLVCSFVHSLLVNMSCGRMNDHMKWIDRLHLRFWDKKFFSSFFTKKIPHPKSNAAAAAETICRQQQKDEQKNPTQRCIKCVFFLKNGPFSVSFSLFSYFLTPAYFSFNFLLSNALQILQQISLIIQN